MKHSFGTSMNIIVRMYVVFVCVMLIARTGVAQVNIEKFRSVERNKGPSGYVELDLSSRSGNVDITELSMSCRSDYTWETMNSFVIVKVDYGWSESKRFSDEALAHVRHVFRTDMILQPEVFLQIDYNKKRLLLYRDLLGSGLQMRLLERTQWKLNWGTALMLEHEKHDIEVRDDKDNETNLVRWSNYLTTSLIVSERIAWTSTNYIQPDIQNFGDVRILCDSSLEVGLGKQLTLVVTFLLRYDSEPLVGVESTDTDLDIGFAYRF